MGKTTEPPGAHNWRPKMPTPSSLFRLKTQELRGGGLCQQRLGAPARFLGSPLLGLQELDYISCRGTGIVHSGGVLGSNLHISLD